MRQAAVVAYHGAKPEPLAALVLAVQQQLAQELGAAFRPRPLTAVHATLVGLERTEHHRPVSRNRHALHGSDEPMDLPGLFGHLCSELRTGGLTVQFGGFSDRDYRISSRGARLYERGFLLAGGQSVLIGWPIGPGGEPTLALDRIRRSAQRFNVVHKYHRTPASVDADCYLVVGSTEPPDLPDLPAELQAGAERRLRELLSRNRTAVALTAADLSLVAYTDVTLPEASTLALPLCPGEREALAFFEQATRPPG